MPTHFPAVAGVAVIRILVADPLVDFAQRHALLGGAVNRKRDEVGVTVSGLDLSSRPAALVPVAIKLSIAVRLSL